MSKITLDTTDMAAIGDAIRTKLNVETPYKAREMPAAILSIPGGGITPTGTISIDSNGTYDVTQYASAAVNVSGGGGEGIYIGPTAPTAALGEDGDLYLRTYPLPDTARYVEYVQSARGQYIKTGVNTSRNISIYAKIYAPSVPGSGISGTVGVAGGRKGEDGQAFNYGTIINIFNNTITMDHGKGTASDCRTSLSYTADRIYELVCGATKYCNGKIVTSRNLYTDNYAYTGEIEIYLMATHQLDSGEGTDKNVGIGCKAYRMALIENGVVIRDFLPALDENDVPCMYDSITGSYLYNAGTGALTYGSSVTPSELPPTLYRKESGQWKAGMWLCGR